ncbi:MAG: hypothetical protein J2P23_00050 [Microlunatus sp.]|nr:hypothetical protein [Microlunatus sp.]
MPSVEAVTTVRGEEALFRRVEHLFAVAEDVACAANDLSTFAWRHGSGDLADTTARRRGQVRLAGPATE